MVSKDRGGLRMATLGVVAVATWLMLSSPSGARGTGGVPALRRLATNNLMVISAAP
jgi:hypothetical protein